MFGYGERPKEVGMDDELIQRARNNLTFLRGEMASAKEGLDHPSADLEQLSVAVEIVKADAAIAQAELLARIASSLESLVERSDAEG